MMINLQIKETTLAIILAGLYTAYHTVNVYAIPYDIYLILAKELIPFLENWDYDLITFEDWIKHNLLIYPKQALSEDELSKMSINDIYLEYPAGNMILVITANIGV